MYSTEVEKQDKVLKPYFPRLTLIAILSPKATKTLLPYWISTVLCFVLYRIFLPRILKFTQVFIDTIRQLHQLLMGPFFDQLPFVHHQYLIGIPDGR